MTSGASPALADAVAEDAHAPPRGGSARSAGSGFAFPLLLVLVLVCSFLLKLNHLGHASIKALDESFHAVVARNLIKHPLTPTLYDRPWLAYDYRDWQSNHVWLHKPIVPLWQMAGSMALLGSSTLAMRLPSAILATAAAWLTYAIGARLLGRRAALIAATLQAFNPAITSLVHGYVFSDHVDVALLFWVELSVYCLVRAIGTGATDTGATDTGAVGSGPTAWTVAAGFAQGIAFHSKTYPAFVVTGIALVACLLLPWGFAGRPTKTGGGFKARHLLILLASTLLAIAPWTIWCAVRFPRELAWEQLQVFRHLGTNVEGWAGPWDRVIFDFLVRVFHVFYPAVLAAAVVLLPRAWRERNLNLALVYAWALGVVVPFTLATSKTPTATLIGWPAMLLLLGELIARATGGGAGPRAAGQPQAGGPGGSAAPEGPGGTGGRGGPGGADAAGEPVRRGELGGHGGAGGLGQGGDSGGLGFDGWCLGAWMGATVVGVLAPGRFALTGWGYPDPPRFAGVLLENLWVVRHLLAALLFAGGIGFVFRKWHSRRLAEALIALASLASIWLCFRTVRTAHAITEVNRQQPAFAELGSAVRAHLPPNAVLLLEIREKSEHIMAMFHADRSVYPVTQASWPRIARAVAAAGGLPLLVTDQPMPLPPAFDQPLNGRRVYAIPPTLLDPLNPMPGQ